MLPYIRIFKFAFLLLWNLIPLLIRTRIRGYDLDHALKIRQKFCRQGLKALGLKVEIEGSIPDYAGMFVCNHKSYFDPVIALAYVRSLPIAMKEIEKWPLIGPGAKATGVVYVDRKNQSSRKATIDAIRKIINMGQQALIYPEGKTTGSRTTEEFKSGSFKLASKMGFEVFPMAISYRRPEIAWADNTPFAKHGIQALRKAPLDVKVRFGQPIFHPNSEELLERTQSWIDQALLEMEAEWKN